MEIGDPVYCKFDLFYVKFLGDEPTPLKSGVASFRIKLVLGGKYVITFGSKLFVVEKQDLYHKK